MYAKRRDIMSAELLNNANESEPSRMDMLRYDIHATKKRMSLKKEETYQAIDSLRSQANQTLPSTLIGVAIFLGTLTPGGNPAEVAP